MNEITMLGVDLAKNVFQLHAVDAKGNKVFSRSVQRKKLLQVVADLPACSIIMEACSGAHYWAREFNRLGHQAKLISPQFVKPFVKTNKNDAADAQAICEAASRPAMRYVPVKNKEQIDIQALHRVRTSCVSRRTSLGNQIRGRLAEHGIVLPQGLSHIRNKLPHILEDPEAELTMMARDYLSDMLQELFAMDERISKYDKQILKIAMENEACRRLIGIPGIGPVTATILVAAVGDGKEFKNGRHLAAWLGLVPRQHSTGGKSSLRGISKRGDSYIRSLLIQGAHNLVRQGASPWLIELTERRGYSRACVAQANKTARIAWNVLAKEEEYRAA